MELGLVRNESGHPTEWVSPSQVALQGTIKSPIKGPAPTVRTLASSVSEGSTSFGEVGKSQSIGIMFFCTIHFTAVVDIQWGRGGSIDQKGSVSYSDIKLPLTPCHLITEAITQMET